MIIVADSSPFVVLVSVEHVDVLATVFREVIIPPQVQAELASPKRSEAVRAFIAAPPSWLRVVSPSARLNLLKDFTPVSLLPFRSPRSFELIGLSSMRVSAGEPPTERGLRVIGTIGVLEAAADLGLIDLSDAFLKVKRPISGSVPRSLTSV